MHKAFTLIEEIIVIIIIVIIGFFFLPNYMKLSHHTHESVLINFTRNLNRTIGEEMWVKSIATGKKGSIKNLEKTEDGVFLSKYIYIPEEINISSVNLSNCGDNEFKTVMTINSNVVGENYYITCKNGNSASAPFFKLIRKKDKKTLVSR